MGKRLWALLMTDFLLSVNILYGHCDECFGKAQHKLHEEAIQTHVLDRHMPSAFAMTKYLKRMSFLRKQESLYACFHRHDIPQIKFHS